MLGMRAPELYLRQSPVPNAYTLAVQGRRPFVVVHSALAELLNPAELQAVLAHELGHLLCDHGRWLNAAHALAMGARALPGPAALLSAPAEAQVSAEPTLSPESPTPNLPDPSDL